MTRDIASDTEVLTAVLRPWIGGFDFVGGRVVTGLLRFLLSGAQHAISGVVARKSACDAGIIAGHALRDGDSESIQREQLM